MGKRGHAIGMVLCIVMAIASQIYSEQINDLFQIDVKGSESTAAPLVGLQQNESWLVVLVDFDSNPLNHVLMHQTIVGNEALLQMEMADDYPDILVGCTGGGSNFSGLKRRAREMRGWEGVGRNKQA